MNQQYLRRINIAKLVTVFLFFFSGLTSLGYEILWFRQLSGVWGNSSIAVATVVASFLSGLGLGAWVSGHRIRNSAAGCIRIYGLLELGIAVLALVIPFELALMREHVLTILPVELESAPAWFIIRFSITFFVLGPPCVMMGATLPVLAMAMLTTEGEADEPVAALYAVNTGGAAVGCLLTGFYLLPVFGLVVTNYLFVAVNMAIGLFALVVAPLLNSRVSDDCIGISEDKLEKRDNPSFSLLALCVASVFSGFSSLALQMTWSRQLALVFGSSTYGFTATLFVVLLGVAIGSVTFRCFKSLQSNSVRAFAIIVIMLNASVACGAWLLPNLCEYVGFARSIRAWPSLNAVVCVTAASAIQLIPCVAMGIVFPMLVGFCRRLEDSIGENVGKIYATNTLGAVCVDPLGDTQPGLIPPASAMPGISTVSLTHSDCRVCYCRAPGRVDCPHSPNGFHRQRAHAIAFSGRRQLSVNT